MKTWNGADPSAKRRRDRGDVGRSAAHLVAFVLLLALAVLLGA